MQQTAVRSREAARAERLDGDVERQVTETVGRWSASLLRTARRHSLCDADAEDAYQRTLELYLRHVGRLDPERVHLWLHTVAKHEAMAVRDKRVRGLATEDDALERVEGRTAPSPEERAVDFERLERAAEALGTLKPAELQALWLQAHGMSYKEIASATDWTYTKVNRCLTEGRRSFLRAFERLEAGEGCDAFADALGRLAAGELRARQVPGLRAHLRHCGWCRAGLRERRAPAALAVLLPAAGVPVLGGEAGAPEAAAHAIARLADAVGAHLHERAVGAAVRAQATLDTVLAGGGKAAAVAASATALAGGGAVAAEEVRDRAVERAAPAARVALQPAGDPRPRAHAPAGAGPSAGDVRLSAAPVPHDRPVRPRPVPRRRAAASEGRRRVAARRAARTEFRSGDGDARGRREFGGAGQAAQAAPAPAPAAAPVAAAPVPAAPPPPAPAASFESAGGSTGSGEFGG